MPLTGLLQVTGITGTARMAGFEGNIPVVAFTHEVKADLDPVTNLPSGQRTHGPLNVSVLVSFASPELHQAHRENTKLTVSLKLFRNPRSGPPINYMIITLSEARIVNYKLTMPSVNTSELMHEYDEFSFAYTGFACEVIPPSEGLEKDAYARYTMRDPDGMLAKPIKFGPEWLDEKAKDGVKKAYTAAKDQAKKEFDEEIKKLEGGK